MIENTKRIYNELKLNLPKKIDNFETSFIDTNRDNVVSKDKLQFIYLKTLKLIAEYLSHTFGPMGSNTKIITGNDSQTVKSEYTKDGHKTLKHIMFSNPIEMSIKAEIEEITRHVEHEVGDGTTSAALLAAKIYEYIISLINDGFQPYEVIYSFQTIIKMIQDEILNEGHEADLDDIYDICMISTNGNKEVSKNIVSIYEKYGLEAQIDVNISPTTDNLIKVYDGMTLSEGYSDPAYINNVAAGVAELHNPKIYAFIDPIDDMNMISLFEKIIIENIVEPIKCGDECIPTVIVSPKMSHDMGSLMQTVIEIMYGSQGNQKPPLLVITDISGSDEGIFIDIARLCGCKYIRKYIDPKTKEVDEKKGLAATINNVTEFAGSAEVVISDVSKTKFVNPSKLRDEYGNFSNIYTSQVEFLQSELDNAKANGEDSRSIGSKKKRLKSLQSNNIEYLIGGISVADRDSERDLVVDAVKNCSSAINNGVGYAANFEGLTASIRVYRNLLENKDCSELEKKISTIILYSYIETFEQLYETVFKKDEIDDKVIESLDKGMPINLRTKEITGNVKTSIMTDVKILEAISKLITIMGTSNQCILQAPQLNNY